MVLPGSTTSERTPPDSLLGRTEPRLSTAPLRRLTRRTSLGFEVIEFAEVMLGVDLLPWQKHWLIHALELDDGGGFRFRTILTLVARQNGKTHLLKILALYFMYLGRARLVLGAAQSLDIARESWLGTVDMAESDPELKAEIAGIRRTNGEQELVLGNGARYKIRAATRSAGRGLSTDLLILDELREQRDWTAWAALSKTTMARPNALIVGISNAGDDQSVVLNNLRATALAGTDPSLCLLEWSAEEGCDLDDPEGIAQANPGLGYTITYRAIMSSLSTDPPPVYRTEILCQRVESLDGAFDLGAWRACFDASGSMDSVRDRVVAVVDVAPDGAHATLTAAAVLDDGRVRVEPVKAWSSTEEARDELRPVLDKMGPRAVGWLPSGPAAALGPVVRSLPFEVVELKGQAVTEACQSFADLIAARRILHNGDPLQDNHIAGAAKLHQGDGWRIARNGYGHVDAAYAAAGAVHVALTLPVEVPLPRSAVY